MTEEKIKPTVRLSETNGNAFAIMGKVIRALKKSGYSKEQICLYQEQSMDGDYSNLLRVAMEWVNVE